MHTALATAIALGVATALSAQTAGAGRVPTPGRVFDAEHKPVAGAQVTLVARGEQEGLDGGDLVRIVADAEGRFRAALLPTRHYAAWASSVRDATTFVSDKVDLGTEAVELVVADTAAVTQLRFVHHDEWRQLGRMRVRVLPFDCAALRFEGDLDEHGIVAVPWPLPDAEFPVEIICDGKLVDAMAIPLRPERPLRPPQRVRVRVADENGAPIAKAAVHRVLHRWASAEGPFLTRPRAARWALATTDDAGTAEVLFAGEGDLLTGTVSEALILVAAHEGYEDGMSGRVKRPFVNRDPIKDATARQGVLPFVLKRSESIPVKVQAPEGAMPREVLWLGARLVPLDGRSKTSALDGARLQVTDGVFQLPTARQLADEESLAIAGCLPPFAPDDPWQPLAVRMTFVVPGVSLRGSATLDLRSLQALRVRVVDAAGAPAMAADLICMPRAGSSYVDSSQAMRTVTDRAGRAVVPMLPGGCVVAVAHGNAFAHAVIEVQPGLDVQTLSLQPLPSMRVVMHDADGKPLAGCRFDANGSTWSPDRGAETEMLNKLGWSVSHWSLSQATSDADGRADLHFLDVPGLKLDFRVTREKRQADKQRLRVSEEPVEITLR